MFEDKNNLETLYSESFNEEPDYWFIGGLRYGKDIFSTDSEASITYPYTTYYVNRVQSFSANGKTFIPLSEMNLPLIVLQFDERCLAARIDPVIETEEGPAHHFIGIEDGEIEIVLPEKFKKTVKDAEWLGKGSKKTVENPEVKEFDLEFREYSDWRSAVQKLLEDSTDHPEKAISSEEASQRFNKASRWMWRSWDEDQDVFLQLPWRERPGFALSEYSYGLTSNEAVRLDYFRDIGEDRGLKEFKNWSKKLEALFRNPEMSKEDLKTGKGLSWYNTVYFNGEGLEGDFYLGTGYYGYPGGQSIVSDHLLNFLRDEEDAEIEEKVRKNLEYILSTQKSSGHWPASIKQEPELPLKKSDYYGKISHGATGKSVKTLLNAYQLYGDEKYRDSALKGLDALETDRPICINGLRDVGTDEAEAFSAFAVIEAFLEGYKVFDNEDFLVQAENYCFYLATCISMYQGELDLKGVCHPISETITQRISPFETVKAARTFFKASKLLENDIWRDMAFLCLSKSFDTVNDTGGLSEGIFYDFTDGENNLETEQTFATAEFLHTLHLIDKESSVLDLKPEKKEDKRTSNNLELSENSIILKENDVFDLDCFGFSKISGEACQHGIEFNGFVTRYSVLRSSFFSKLRTSKFLMAPKDLSYLWKGIQPKKTSTKKVKFQDLDKEVEASEEDDSIRFKVSTDVYTVSGEAYLVEDEGKDVPVIDFSFQTDMHDLTGEKVVYREDKVLNGFDRVLNVANSEDCDEGFDLSRGGNWTDGGVYNGSIRLEEDV